MKLGRGGSTLLLATWLLAGCAEMRLRDEAQQHAMEGRYETALGTLERGLREHPESTLLRSAELRLRSETQLRLLAQAASARAAGRLDEALKLLSRAETMDPGNDRVASLKAEIDVARRQDAALVAAEEAAQQGRRDEALRRVATALRDNPRHAALLALQRRLEMQLRQAQSSANMTVLAETRPVSLDFRDAALRTVIDAVSRHSGVNFILDKDIRSDSRVTVFLRSARVEDAIDLIIGTQQLAKKVIDPTTLIIYPNTPEKQREYQEQVVRVFHLASAEAKGAAAFLRSMLRIKEPFVDERANMVALRDSAENIQLAERLMALYDASEPEVMLDVEILEVRSSRLTELGVKFPDTFSLTPLAPAGSTGLTVSNLQGLDGTRVGVGVAGLIVNLRREVGDFTTLANPRIRARNKEKAKILIGDKIPVITTTAGTGGFVSESVNYLDVGIKLEVEPTVFADDDVAIRLALEVSSLGNAVKTTTGALAYQIGTRNANTMLRLRDGETQVLGGLISKDERSSSNRVPGLGDLPVLGRVFRSQLDDGSRTELILAITPRVLRNIRAPEASEAELWVGTDALPRLRPAGPGLRAPEGAGALGRGDANAQRNRAPTGVPAGAAAGPPADNQPVAPSESNALRWMAAPDTAKAGDPVEVTLGLDAAVPLRGLSLELAFPADLLRLVEVADAGYFARDGVGVSVSRGGNEAGGESKFSVMRVKASGAAGEGAVAKLKFVALKPGRAEVWVRRVVPTGVNGQPPPFDLAVPWTLKIQ